MNQNIQQLQHQDILPSDVWKWNHVENIIRKTMELYNFQEIRTSILQSQDLFKTYLNFFSEHSDYINQLLYNINDNSNLSLRPEGTITVLHSLMKNPISDFLSRLFYIGPMFRKRNNSNLSQFHQFGAEIIGSNDLLTDNEIILLAIRIFKNLELYNIKLELNSFGCEICRPAYIDKMNHFVADHQNEFCDSCQYNLHLNKLQVFQCNDEMCVNISKEAPNIIDHLCDECSSNLKSIQKMLSNLGVTYSINPNIQSAFNYYNRTIFNFIYELNGAKYILANGGRYDMLSKSVTGKDMPAIGFSANLELIIQLMNEMKLFSQKSEKFKILIAPMSPDMDIIVLQIVQGLHDHNIHTIIAHFNGEFASMQELVDSYQTELVVYITEEFIRQGKIIVKNNIKSHQEPIYIGELNDYVIRLKKSISI